MQSRQQGVAIAHKIGKNRRKFVFDGLSAPALPVRFRKPVMLWDWRLPVRRRCPRTAVWCRSAGHTLALCRRQCLSLLYDRPACPCTAHV